MGLVTAPLVDGQGTAGARHVGRDMVTARKNTMGAKQLGFPLMAPQ